VRRGVVALAIALTIAAAACGGGGGTTHEVDPANVPEIPTIEDAVIATATVPTVEVYAEPEASEPELELPNPWLLNEEADKPIDQVFLVEEQRDGWVKVLLPERPNGRTGWIESADVELQTTPYRIDVQLGARLIFVYEGNEVLLKETIAIGTPETPTPPGQYYIRVLLESIDPTSVYGPFAYGLSAHSEVLTEFSGGDAEVGIHGNNDASVLGQPVTSGCIRMSNEGITMLTELLPLGTPVEIRA
jgi:lipoprotein-anchoring transpeptidase ErfK/SrfK